MERVPLTRQRVRSSQVVPPPPLSCPNLPPVAALFPLKVPRLGLRELLLDAFVLEGPHPLEHAHRLRVVSPRVLALSRALTPPAVDSVEERDAVRADLVERAVGED